MGPNGSLLKLDFYCFEMIGTYTLFLYFNDHCTLFALQYTFYFWVVVLLTWTTPADIGSVGIVLTKEMQNHAEILLMQISALLMMGHLNLIGKIFVIF